MFYPLNYNVESISIKGVVNIKFNQEILVPDFSKLFDAGLTGEKRHLQESTYLQRFNVDRDILSIKMICYNPDENAKLEYSLVLQEWTDRELKVKINFTDPGVVSQGFKKDKIMVTIRNKNLFVAKESGEMLKIDRLITMKKVPQ